MRKIQLSIIIALILPILCEGARVLVLTPMGSKSHKTFYMGLSKILADRGYKVTIVSAFANSKPYPNVRDYVMKAKPITQIIDNQDNIFDEMSNDQLVYKLMNDAPAMCVEALATKEMQDLKKQKFDIIILSMFVSDCFASIVYHQNVPLILMSPAAIVGPMFDITGEVHFTSLSGLPFLTGTYPYNFFYRFKSTVLTTFVSALMKYYTYPKYERLCKERGLCPQDMPPIAEIYSNASLSVSNSVRTLDIPPQPSMPHVIHIGGSHCVPGQPLPKDLEEWIQGAGENGFIFFSLGSVLPPSKMPENFRKILVNVFGSLKQRVLWKWDTTMEDLPSNVRLGKWLPQQDILAHPKLKLFISHGGILSTIEATYHGAPILGMPVFGDQHANINYAVNQGWAMSLLWSELTEEKLKSKIQSVMNNNKMKAIVKERAKLMNDAPISPKTELIYWIEYVLRHKGAKHLRSPMHDLSIIQLYNIDVWAILMSSVAILLGAIIYLIRTILKCCFGTKSVSSKKKNKNKKE